jgi:MFS family permease
MSHSQGTTTGSEHPLPASPLTAMPPTTSVGANQPHRYPLFAIPLAMLAMVVMLLPPAAITMTLRLRELDATSAAGNLSIVLGIGAAFAFVTAPIAGRLSDRTTSRFGMRKPWILGGAIGLYIAIVIIAFAPNTAIMAIGWSFAQISFNFALSSLVAMLPDQISPSRRGRVASFFNLIQNAGFTAAAFVVQLFPVGHIQDLLPSLIGGVALFAIIIPIKDRVQTEKRNESFNIKQLFGAFVFNPRKHPDLGWAWLTRFLVTMGYSTATTYLAVFLIDHIGVSDAKAPSMVFQANLAATIGLTISTVVVGWLSDKVGRRKPFVFVAGFVAMIGLVVLALAGDFQTVLIGEAIIGLGSGAFFAIDLALITDVLPSAETAGKDLGVVNIAQALPQSLVPALAPAVIAGFGYPGLFIGGAIVGIAGAFSVLGVRKVR